jgi:hypothetical protein
VSACQIYVSANLIDHQDELFIQNGTLIDLQ